MFLIVNVFLLLAGQFLLSLSRQHGSVAQVVSEWVQEKETSCFTLWYHMETRSAQKQQKTAESSLFCCGLHDATVQKKDALHPVVPFPHGLPPEV